MESGKWEPKQNIINDYLQLPVGLGVLTQWENSLDLVFFLFFSGLGTRNFKVESCWLRKVPLLRRGHEGRKVGGPSAESV